ncbi:MAG: hypothetical protein K8R68_09855 [Bacteroidales bacterium]|nr:hypothetical protein [Bacteroidales bacterium]
MHRYIFIFAILIFLRPYQLRALDKIISHYEETIQLTELGDAQVAIEVMISSCKDSVINFPLNFDQIKNLSTQLEYTDQDSLAGTIPVHYNKIGAKSFIKIDYSQNKGEELILKMSFLAPGYINFEEAGPGEFDAYNWSYRFTNLSQFKIENYSVKLILPEGYNYHSVTESLPKFTKKNPTPPYHFEKIDKTNQLTMTASSLSFGDNVFVSFVFKSSQKSIWIIIVGGIIIILYLIFFRDIRQIAQQLIIKRRLNKTGTS